MWPMKLDMTRDECRGVLRRLELESYGAVMSTFRAQGCLSKEKAQILEDLRRMLHISSDRHRAEARRVANDEQLTTVAEVVAGPNSSQDWRREGHRTFPVLPRTVPHTALTYIANTVYEQLTRANTKLLHPLETSYDRLKKADEKIKFELVRRESVLFENGFVRDAAVVTSDPLQDIMSKSYINREPINKEPINKEPINKDPINREPVNLEPINLEPVNLEPINVEPTNVEPTNVEPTKRDSPSKAAETTTIESEEEKISDKSTEEITDNPEPEAAHPSLCEILLNKINRPNNTTKPHNIAPEKPTKPVERAPRKKPQATKRTWKSKALKLLKQAAPKPIKPPPPPRVNSFQSPHLIHSYAVRLDGKATANGGARAEPLQLQQHLTSTMPQNSHGTTVQSSKSQQYDSSSNYVSAIESSSKSRRNRIYLAAKYSHARGILPSSKKDIQYNLARLNPPCSSSEMKGNVNIPLRRNEYHAHGNPSPHPLLQYHKKSPSKNVLIPNTSTAAATLASLGLPRPLQLPLTDHSSNWGNPKNRDGNVKPIKRQSHADTASVKAIPASSPGPVSVENSNERICAPTGNSIAGPDSTSNQSMPCTVTDATTANPLQNTDLNGQAKANITANPGLPSPVTNNVSSPKQPTLAGFTAVKRGSRLSVNKMHLVPLGTPIAGGQTSPLTPSVQKSNVFILPKSTAIPEKLNLGQKITLPKSVVESSSAASSSVGSPPKVVPQTVSKPCNAKSGPRESTTDQKIISQDSKITAGEQKKAVERKVSSDGQPSAQKPTPTDGPLPRKIKISPSQKLLPFKGTLHAMPDPGSITVGRKKMKMSNDSTSGRVANSSAATGANEMDWEQELDRANSYHSSEDDGQSPNVQGTLSNGINSNSGLTNKSSEQHDQPSGVPEEQSTEATATNMAESRVEVQKAPAKSHLMQMEITVQNRNNSDEMYSNTITRLSPFYGAGVEITTEQGDDSSVTDSADAEDDLDDEPIRVEEYEDIEEDDYNDEYTVEVEMESDDMIIEEEPATYDSMIEEVLDDFVEEDDGEREEYVADGYGTTRDLVVELDSTTEEIIEEHPIVNGDIVHEELVPEMQVQYDRCEDDADVSENGDMLEESFTESDGIVCDLLEVDSDGKYHPRPFSYDEMVSQGLDSLPHATKRTQQMNPSVS